MGAAVGEHLLELLLLRIVQQRFDLRLAFIEDLLCLCAAIAAREAGVCAKILHLLLPVCEDRSDLRDLVARQAELLAEMRGLPGGIDCALMIIHLRCCGLRCISRWGLICIRRLREQCAR